MTTIFCILILGTWAIDLFHWGLRGGRYVYGPVSRGLQFAGIGFMCAILLTAILCLFGRIHFGFFVAIAGGFAIVQAAHAIWRRELDHQSRSKVA